MKVDKAIWEVELKKLEDSTCAHWTNKGFKIKEIVSSNATESSSVGRNKTILWSKKYTCHRGPNVYVSKASGNHRPIQKESKKIGCPTCIMVTCYHSNPEFVIFERKNMHSHVPGSYADLKFMSLSDALRRKIKAFLQYGFSRREIRSCLLQEIDEGAEERDKLFHYDDFYNIWLSVAKDMFKFKENEFESLKVWEEKLAAINYKVLSYSMGNTFYYGIISPWQMSIMEVSKSFYLDSTFGISSRSSEVLYSLVVRHPDTGKGVPVGYMITNDQSVTPVLNWLRFLKNNCAMSPEQITIDCSIPESDAIRATFGGNCRIQLCLFHVAQCWSRNLATKVKNSPEHSNAKVVRGNIMSDLQSIMYETTCAIVVEKVRTFREKWTAQQPQFVEYFEDKWLALDGYKRWSAAYVIEEHQNMRTNNYIESWHKQLKSVYLKRIKNRRLDRLIFILVNEVENDMKLEEARVSSEVGKMGPETRNRRKREMIAAAIPDDRMKEMITKESETTYNVESFSQEDIMYTVQINEAGNIASCSCCYFKFNSRACASPIPENELLAPTAENDSNINATSILKRDIKLELDSLRHLKRSINAINDYESLTDISKRLRAIRDDIDSRDRSKRMETQRSSNS
ncbi:hypothetical protein RO3G_09365 [Rhizopus delemar RA 99-880]|uniref:MULE transposase domain-containing protein n=1 Tax=Rhizopus delemar (strain RA 99-880 / ATCC MYA-4621 / FGSC 9543 / NRRL 43880) TaxID=246409 RepID=I1C875_RHIO9|nr:hypothetical protein RO3G_09365 [Rhizopus delemar RA 99-880]|eukprot:EIE84655.1 hypothetical protein RO3G_09365 [Rhizopus delemar RA 99-880]